jgi:hypothetical protein
VLNACASVVALEEGSCVHQQIIQSGLELDVFVGSSFMDMYAKCGHLEMWSLGLPYLESVPSMGTVRKFLNFLNRCVKRVYNQMISLLFVFCQLAAM